MVLEKSIRAARTRLLFVEDSRPRLLNDRCRGVENPRWAEYLFVDDDPSISAPHPLGLNFNILEKTTKILFEAWVAFY